MPDLAGIRISAPGVDVKTAQPHELYYSSEYDSLKAAIVGSASMTFLAANATQNLDIAHGLAYTPASFVLVKINANDSVPCRFSNLFGDLSARVATITAVTDATKLRITVNGFPGAGDVTIDFKYYIFHNQLD